MRSVLASVLLAAFFVAVALPARAQSAVMSLPQNIAAGSAFSISTTGSGKAVLYIVGPGQALRRNVQLGEAVSFAAGILFHAGRYLVILTGPSTDNGELSVTPAHQPDTLSFLAKPSRVPVGRQNGISGTAYVFDAYRNLITKPLPVSFTLSEQAGGAAQTQTATTRNGVAWTRMNSAAKEGSAKFVAQADGASSMRVIEEVPGSPCGLTMHATAAAGGKVNLQTAPVRDCTGNAVPDGTIVTFTETYDGEQSTADVPIKKGIAQVVMPARIGARISVASGVVAGNEIRWRGR